MPFRFRRYFGTRTQCGIEGKQIHSYENEEIPCNCQNLVHWQSHLYGLESEEEAKIVSRRFARQLQRLGYNVRFTNFKIHNCHGSVLLPFQIKIIEFSQAHQEASYEPELHAGIIYKVEAFSATLRIHRSGRMTIMAPSEIDIKEAVEFTSHLVQPFAIPNNDTQNEELPSGLPFGWKKIA